MSTTAKRLEVWEEAVAASEKHLLIAKQLQREGLEGLKAAQTEKGVAGRLRMKESRGILEQGVTMEKEAYEHLLYLHRTKPKVRGKA